MRPASTAMVAGTASLSRTAASIANAVDAFSGHGNPCVMSVDSSATTGRASRSAASTWGATYRKSVIQDVEKCRVDGSPAGASPHAEWRGKAGAGDRDRTGDIELGKPDGF